jgi:hypothetical protein
MEILLAARSGDTATVAAPRCSPNPAHRARHVITDGRDGRSGPAAAPAKRHAAGAPVAAGPGSTASALPAVIARPDDLADMVSSIPQCCEDCEDHVEGPSWAVGDGGSGYWHGTARNAESV